jgi:hypothetical protein
MIASPSLTWPDLRADRKVGRKTVGKADGWTGGQVTQIRNKRSTQTDRLVFQFISDIIFNFFQQIGILSGVDFNNKLGHLLQPKPAQGPKKS